MPISEEVLPEVDKFDSNDNVLEADDDELPPRRHRRDSYFAINGAALILHKSECIQPLLHSDRSSIQPHLQAMIAAIQLEDTIKLTVKIVSDNPEEHTRYLSLVEHFNSSEYVVLGFDFKAEEMRLGFVLPVFSDLVIRMDGDGGFSLSSSERSHSIKPVSVQTMWTCIQSVNKAVELARVNKYNKNGPNHGAWINYYSDSIDSDQSCLIEWNQVDDICPWTDTAPVEFEELQDAEVVIRNKLKLIMMSVDLDEVTAKEIRTELEEELGMSLEKYKAYIDDQMILVMGQMEKPTKIFDFLYLGSEFNALNLEEMQANGVEYVLNVTKEIDNFYPANFTYHKIRVLDIESEDLLKHFDRAYHFIMKAKESNAKCLVHCKMGISRSGSTVVSFVMKFKNWSLTQSLDYVKSKRSIVCPNEGFMKQLKIYEGILDASGRRYLPIWERKGEEEEINSPVEYQDNPNRVRYQRCSLSGDMLQTIRKVGAKLCHQRSVSDQSGLVRSVVDMIESGKSDQLQRISCESDDDCYAL